jgi:mRNA-degrading endonuclease RelE of RelBE toxin-antitoxin system
MGLEAAQEYAEVIRSGHQSESNGRVAKALKGMHDFLGGSDMMAYRLRVDEFRVFYDVRETTVYVMRVLPKSAVADYLKELGYEVEDGQR